MTQPAGAILAVDPGRDKCGIAVVYDRGDVLLVPLQEVIPAAELAARVQELARNYQVSLIVIGDRTGADAVREALQSALPDVQTITVDEHRSSEEARRLYFRHHPPRGWRRLIPLTLQTPPRPYDDYVAVILALRYLRTRSDAAL